MQRSPGGTVRVTGGPFQHAEIDHDFNRGRQTVTETTTAPENRRARGNFWANVQSIPING